MPGLCASFIGGMSVLLSRLGVLDLGCTQCTLADSSTIVGKVLSVSLSGILVEG